MAALGNDLFSGSFEVTETGRWQFTVEAWTDRLATWRDELQRKHAVSAAEAGHLDLHRRALVGVAVVAADAQHCRTVLDACERLVASHPEVEVLSARQRLYGEDD
mgnify:CR=1 FL=1